MTTNPTYRITASHLNAFQYWKNSDWDKISEEKQVLYLTSTIYDAYELQKLINKINRVYSPTTEAMAQGKCFEALINQLLRADAVATVDYTVEYSVNQMIEDIFCCEDEDGKPWCDNNSHYGKVQYKFTFPSEIINRVLDFLQNERVHSQQYFVEKNIEVSGRIVELYGFVDYCGLDCVIDLKTTGSYKFPKYDTNWQRYVYGYCLRDSVDTLQFLVAYFDYQRKKLVATEIYHETYSMEYEDFSGLRAFIAEFIDFLETHRERITDKKIFGGENPVIAKPNETIKILQNIQTEEQQ
jgi:hypothetical protein